MKRLWKDRNVEQVFSDQIRFGSNVRYFDLVLGDDYREFSLDVKKNDLRRSNLPVDLELLLEADRIDLDKRKAPVVLFLANSRFLFELSKDPFVNSIINSVPRGYRIINSSSVKHGFYSDFYTGIDEALPSLVIATEDSRVSLPLDIDDDKCFAKLDLENACKRRNIPLIRIPNHIFNLDYDVTKVSRYIAAQIKQLKLPAVNKTNFGEIYGNNYPVGEFLDRGVVKQMPYAVINGSRIPIVCSASMVVSEGKQYLMIKEGKEKIIGETVSVLNKYDLPGGGIDPGEGPVECVLREFSEETPYVGNVNFLLGLYCRVKELKKGKVIIMKAAYMGEVTGEHEGSLESDSLGVVNLEPSEIESLGDELKSPDIVTIVSEADTVGLTRVGYNVELINHPGVVR